MSICQNCISVCCHLFLLVVYNLNIDKNQSFMFFLLVFLRYEISPICFNILVSRNVYVDWWIFGHYKVLMRFPNTCLLIRVRGSNRLQNAICYSLISKVSRQFLKMFLLGLLEWRYYSKLKMYILTHLIRYGLI